MSGDKRYLSLVPLLLEMSSKVDEPLLEKQRELIELEQDPSQRMELFSSCWVMASRHFSLEIIKKYYKEGPEMLELLEEIPEIKELIDQRMDEKMKQEMEARK